VEALHRGATTPGEREAAARARARLLVHLDRVRQDDPIARFCAEHVADLAVAPAPPPPPELMPSEEEVRFVLYYWETGDWDRDDVCAWASQLVDRVVLPSEADAAAAPLAEVLLQLAALDYVQLLPKDVPRIRRFLRDRDWDAWFALIAQAAAR
jgi:hypothetical protein